MSDPRPPVKSVKELVSKVREAFDNMPPEGYWEEQKHYEETFCQDVEPRDDGELVCAMIDTADLKEHPYKSYRELEDAIKELEKRVGRE